MFRFTIKKVVVAATLAAVSIARAVSAPGAKADGSIGICTSNCTSGQGSSSGNVGLCIDANDCPSWFYWSGYLVWGPKVWITFSDKIETYFVYNRTSHVFIDYIDCYTFLGAYATAGTHCYWR